MKISSAGWNTSTLSFSCNAQQEKNIWYTHASISQQKWNKRDDKKNSNNDTDVPLKRNELRIPAYDIHYKAIGNGKKSYHISTVAFNIRCNPKYSSLLKTLIARCSQNHKNNYTFIPYGFLQMKNPEIYIRHIIFQNDLIVSMAIIQIYSVTKTVMIDKVE